MKRAAGPFEILEILGEGSFGTVCVARVTGDPLRRKVALKILKGAYTTNQKILNRTRDEARLLSRLNHPNIVRVERLMDVGGRPVVVMEHVQGVSLDQLLLRFKDGLPATVALEITRQTCLALHVAYQEALGENGRPMRVIHRDIKPSNVLLSIHGEVKVVDFGIAKGEFEGREAETESVVMGSRPYMAPERLDGISDSPSVDVYSAGMSMFELLTGRTMSLSINPVSHDQAMNRQLGYIQVPGLDAAGVEDLRNLIRRMCAYTRDYRPSALDCARELEALVESVDSRHLVTLPDFARTTVVPIYESRPRITPEEALHTNSDGEFLKEVTGALSNSSTGPVEARPHYTPYIFVAVLGFAVVLLSLLAVVKYSLTNTGEDSSLVRVMVWIPSDAQVRLGSDIFLPTSGHVRLPPGQTTMQVIFNTKPQLNCVFEATDGTSVRTVWDNEQYGISIDDGPVKACEEEKEASTPEGPAVRPTLLPDEG